MSAALVRLALEFVDPDESSDKRKKRGGAQSKSSTGQGLNLDKSKTFKKQHLLKNNPKTEEEKINKEVISKLLKLSKPIVESKITSKIVKRARTGRPVSDKVKVKKESQESILFPDEGKKKSKKAKK